jgi:hypothetical protein
MVQTQRVYLQAGRMISFIFNEFPNWSGALDWDCSQFCSCKNLTLHQPSTCPELLVLNLKDLQEERRVDPLVPKQIPDLVETYGNLGFLSD